MLEKYKIAIITFCSLSFIAILFPPVQWIYQSKLYHSQFKFLFSDMTYSANNLVGKINTTQLFLEIILIAFASFIIQVFYRAITKKEES